MKRREFITFLGGAAALPLAPCAARAQQGERVRRIGVLLGSGIDADDSDMQARIAAFRQALQQLGWTDGRNVQIDVRFASGNVDSIRRFAAELAALAPDVILAGGAAPMPALLQATRTVPIVFTNVVDPVGAGFVDSMARPGGNATGFIMLEYSLAAKWLELLKEIAPGVTRAAVLRDAAISAGTGQFGAIQSVAPSLRVELSPVNVRDAGAIEHAVAAFARAALASGASGQRGNSTVRAPDTRPEPGSSARVPNGGLISTASALTVVHRALIIKIAAQHKLPAVYHRRLFVASGGLISYGPDIIDQFRRAAGYVDRILKGEKPADLPVQAPTKYQLAINLKTAKALGITVPPSLLARADEVIE
jgi:putative ABC transport system substrate-binding protein